MLVVWELWESLMIWVSCVDIVLTQPLCLSHPRVSSDPLTDLVRMSAGFTVCTLQGRLRVHRLDDAGLQVTVGGVSVLPADPGATTRRLWHPVSHLRHLIPDYGENCLDMTGTGIPCATLDCGFRTCTASVCVCEDLLLSNTLQELKLLF